MLRVSFEAGFKDNSAVHLDFGSYIKKDRYTIKGDMVCKRSHQSEIDIPIRQECLALNESYEGEEISKLELRALNNRIGIRSITVSIDHQREPYVG